IEATDSFGCGIGNDRHGVIPNHSVSFVCREFPNGQTPTLVILIQKRVDEILRSLLIDDGVERMRGAERVPKRKDRVVFEAGSLVVLEVATGRRPSIVHK